MPILNSIHPYSPIDWLINQEGRMKRTEGHISTTLDIRTHTLTDILTERRIPLLTDTNQGVTGTGRVYFHPTPPPQNAPVPDPIPSPNPVFPVLDTKIPTTSNPTVVSDCRGVK